MVTLNLTNNQAIMLHALLTNHTAEDIVDMINDNLNDYIKEGGDTYYFTAYRAIKHFINTNPKDFPFNEEDIDLFDDLEWAVEGIGRKLNKKVLEANSEERR